MTIMYSLAGLQINLAYALAMISGVALTAIGFADLPILQSIPWSDTTVLFRFIILLFFLAIAVSSFVKIFRCGIYTAAVAMAVTLAISSGASWPLLVTLIFASAASATGQWIFKRLGMGGEAWITCFLLGAGLYGTIIGLTAHFPITYTGSIGGVLGLSIFFGRNHLLKWISEFGLLMGGSGSKSKKFCFLDLGICVVALVLYIVALMPEVGYDALVSHLFIPSHLLHKHQWGFDPLMYIWAVTPMLGDWIFSITYVLGGETAARFTNIGFIFILGWLIRELVIWAGGTKVAVKWAVLIFLSSPLTFTEGSSLFIESVWASFIVAGSLAILKTCTTEQSNTKTLTTAGAFLGYALAVKAITFTILPSMLLPLVWTYKIWKKPDIIQSFKLGLVLFILIGCVPYITAWNITGNPVFPFFNQVFHSLMFSDSNFEDLRWGKGLTWDFIYRVTFQTGKYMESTPGAAGFQWLLIFLPSTIIILFSKHKRGLSLLVVSLFSIMVCFHSTAYLRYIFPAYILLIVVIGVGITLISKMGWVQEHSIHIVMGISVLLNLLFYSAGPFVYRDFPIYSIFSESNKDAYLSQRLPIRNAVKFVNEININKTPVAIFAYPQVAGLKSNALIANWYNPSFHDAFTNVKTKGDAIELLIKNRIEFVIVDTSIAEFNSKSEQFADVTTKIMQIGTVSVLRFRDDFRFKNEILKNPNFESMDGWRINGDAIFNKDDRIVRVSVDSVITQSVEVQTTQRYRNSVVARCLNERTLGRIQVNWHDLKGQFVGTNIDVFECTDDWKEFSMEIVAPENAAIAEVYISSHSKTKLEFHSVSFKR